MLYRHTLQTVLPWYLNSMYADTKAFLFQTPSPTYQWAN